MAQLDIAEKRLPQDGRISIRLRDHLLDVRVSTLPTGSGERVVLRLLDKRNLGFSLNDLGMSLSVKKEYELCLEKPNGIILVTGPTGSGSCGATRLAPPPSTAANPSRPDLVADVAHGTPARALFCCTLPTCTPRSADRKRSRTARRSTALNPTCAKSSRGAVCGCSLQLRVCEHLR